MECPFEYIVLFFLAVACNLARSSTNMCVQGQTHNNTWIHTHTHITQNHSLTHTPCLEPVCSNYKKSPKSCYIKMRRRGLRPGKEEGSSELASKWLTGPSSISLHCLPRHVLAQPVSVCVWLWVPHHGFHLS